MGEIPLTKDYPLGYKDILIVAATMKPTKPGDKPLADANWEKENSLSIESLAEYYREECERYHGRWANILGED